MAYFKSDFNTFFKELASNNHKDWFDDNRARYHENIKKPFEDFVAVLMSELQKDDPNLNGDPRKAIFRINRDIRFAKDKTPYKLNRAAFISRFGRKAGGYPGLYIHLGPEKVMIGGGVYKPNKQELQSIREYIMNHSQEFDMAINSPGFKNAFANIKGEENKRLPSKELTEAARKQPLLYKKQFFYSADFPAELVTDERLLEFIVEKHREAKPVIEFFEKALTDSQLR